MTMNDGIPVALDGFLDEETVPGSPQETSARFRLIVSPTDERADEMVMPCMTTPALAAAVLHDLVPGDQLRITGYLRLPRTPDEPTWLDVTTLEVLWTAPLSLPADDTDGLDAEAIADLTDLFDDLDLVGLTRAVLDTTPPEDRVTVTRALDDVLGDIPIPGVEDLDP
ncbi:hypothetical protein ACIBAH_32425 [Streptomyces sp. NPDC051445]|uniref:hypothetical protein n=1 Tax=Streptomyces sp. NPDC051445 TaxID=3365653 RepID=UPI0037968FEB